MTFEVEHTGTGQVPSRRGRLPSPSPPTPPPPWTELPFATEPLDIPGLGLAYPVRTKIGGQVAPGLAAAKAGLEGGRRDQRPDLRVDPPGTRMEAPCRWPLNRFFRQGRARPRIEPQRRKSPGWPFAFQAIQFRPLEPSVIRGQQLGRTAAMTPEPVADWLVTTLAGTSSRSSKSHAPARRRRRACGGGSDDTMDNILSIYAMVRSLAQSRVSPKNLGGPIMIAQVAYSAATLGLTELVHFLGI